MAQIQFMRERPDLLPRVLETVLCLLGLSAVAALFLPFTSNTSPWDVTGHEVIRSGYAVYWSDWKWNLFLLGAPFLLAVPISAASLLLMITRRLTQPCWIAAYALGFATAGGTLCLAQWAMSNSQHHEAFLVIPALVSLVGGGALVIRNARRGLPPARNAIIAMQAVYVAGALIPTIGYFGDWDIGAYITLVAIVVYASHVVAVELVVRRTRASSRL
jgi:hypothetical protein